MGVRVRHKRYRHKHERGRPGANSDPNRRQPDRVRRPAAAAPTRATQHPGGWVGAWEGRPRGKGQSAAVFPPPPQPGKPRTKTRPPTPPVTASVTGPRRCRPEKGRPTRAATASSRRRRRRAWCGAGAHGTSSAILRSRVLTAISPQRDAVCVAVRVFIKRVTPLHSPVRRVTNHFCSTVPHCCTKSAHRRQVVDHPVKLVRLSTTLSRSKSIQSRLNQSVDRPWSGSSGRSPQWQVYN